VPVGIDLEMNIVIQHTQSLKLIQIELLRLAEGAR
jgi:hypothetical protein